MYNDKAQLALVLSLALCACGDAHKPSRSSAAPSGSMHAAVAPKSIASTSGDAPSSATCSLEAAKARCTIPYESECVVGAMRPWAATCRRQAFDAECKDRCFSFETDDILAAAADSLERRALLGLRIERNRKSIALADELYERIKTFAAHAAMVGASLKESDPGCFKRLANDFAIIDAFVREVDEKGARMPTGLAFMKSTLLQMKTCVNCSDMASQKSGCIDAMKEFVSDRENLDEMKAELKSDEIALKAMK